MRPPTPASVTLRFKQKLQELIYKPALDAEGSAATTRLLCVWVNEDEVLLHQAALEVERHAIKIGQTFRVNEDLCPTKLKNLILRPGGRFEADQVRKTRTAAATHTQPQSSHVLAFHGV